MKRSMNLGVVSVAFAATLLALPVSSAQAQTQTPGQITKFDPALNVVDSVITEDANGNIAIGTATPAAKMDVARGHLNLEDSTATTGNILKNGVLFLHNFGVANTFMGGNAGNLSMTAIRPSATRRSSTTPLGAPTQQRAFRRF